MVKAPLAFVDLEMTGLDPSADRVIEVCVVRQCGNEVNDSFQSLVNPGQGVRFQTDVHGLNAELLAGAPSFADIAPRVLGLLDGAVLVAHGAAWDVAFLEAELGRLGRAIRFPFYLDTLVLSRRALRAESHALGALAERLAIERGVAHRAADDVRVLRAVFEHLLADLSPQSPRDLWHVRIAERHARPEIVERCLALAGTGEPARVTYRPSHKAPQIFDAIVTQVRTDLDPPRVLGYSLPGRGRFDLRADRILVIDLPSKKSEPSA
jgi:DNA polymerase-3 subunit epsilon